MPKLGGFGFSQIAVLAAGFIGDDWPDRFDAIPATKSFQEWGEGKGVLIASWKCFKGLEGDTIVNIETPVRDDARARVSRCVVWSPAKYLVGAIKVKVL